jgi:hypothetical protein
MILFSATWGRRTAAHPATIPQGAAQLPAIVEWPPAGGIIPALHTTAKSVVRESLILKDIIGINLDIHHLLPGMQPKPGKAAKAVQWLWRVK